MYKTLVLALTPLLILSLSSEVSAQASKYQKRPIATAKISKSKLTMQQRQLMKLANSKFRKGPPPRRTRYLSRTERARAMRIPAGRIGQVYELDARHMYRPGKGSLSAYGAVVSGKDNTIGTYLGEKSSIRIQMERARPGQVYLAECSVAAGRRSPVSFTLFAAGHTVTHQVAAGSTKNVALPFVAARADDYIYMGVSGKPAWSLLGCRITAQN